MADTPMVVTPEASGPTPNRSVGLPVSLFASVMGLAALSIAWHLAAAHFSLSELVADLFGVGAMLGFVVVVAAYSLKLVRHPAAVHTEFADPLARNYFGMPLISLLLLAIVVAPVSHVGAAAAWAAGVTGMIVFAWKIIGNWLGGTQLRSSVGTGWLVVAVGILDIPLAMPVLRVPMTELLGFVCVASGLSLAAALFAVILPRYLFDPPAPASHAPSLLIAVAPFAVGFSSYVTVTAQVDWFAKWLLVLAVTILGGLLVPVGRVLWRSRFELSWWGTSFPVAATAVAALHLAGTEHTAASNVLAVTMLGLATTLVLGLVLGTAIAVGGPRLRALAA